MTRRYRRVEDYSRIRLEDVIHAAEREIDCRNCLGGRVWLLPPVFYRALSPELRNRQVLMDFTCRCFRWPTMYSAAKVYGGVNTQSRVRWTVGKGFIGRITLKNSFDILQHNEFWPENIEAMSAAEWRQTELATHERRSLKDAQTLKSLYGTAVGVGLRHPQTTRPLGCMTIHTSAKQPLTEHQAQTCVELLTVQAVHVAERIAEVARLK